MSDLAQIQKRLSSAFDASSAPQERDAETQAFARFDALHAAGADDDISADISTPDGHDRDRLFRLWLGGGGLLCSGMVLALGFTQPGLYVLYGAIVAIVLGTALFYILERRAGRATAAPDRAPAPAVTTEKRDDRDWEHDENASLLATIHDALGDIAITRDINRRIVLANATFRDLTGKRDPLGLSCEEIGLAFRPTDQPYRYDVEIATAAGQRIFVWHDIIIRDPVAGSLMIQSIARDVTEERLMARERETARLKAESTSAAKSRLLATVSHEIRTPLSGILGMSHLLGQTRVTSEQMNYLNGIRQSGNALVQLVDDLLDFSTIEVGRFQLRPRAESLRMLVESVVEMLSHRAHEKGIEIAATIAADIPEVLSFDPARLRQVLFNVIGNAVKFTHTGGVLIAAALQNDDLTITVTDTGPGMTVDEQLRIFGEFEQAGNASDKSSGTGLGLTISARIMREFGGALGVSSQSGAGSTFTIRFPANIDQQGRPKIGRAGTLNDSAVLLMAPVGPASSAVITTIEALGGCCFLASDHLAAEAILNRAHLVGPALTDIIVDHRMAVDFSQHIATRADVADDTLRKVFLVNPEERNRKPHGLFDAWLIRPLREQSLIDVLRGRMRGMEKRDALNDNQPGFGPSLSETAAHAGLRIVLAEDDPVNAMLVRAMLEKAGHHVQAVDNFEILMDVVLGSADSRPDLVISDLNMPGGEGLDILARIRADERRTGCAAVPVIVLSGDSRDEIRRHALLNGANRVFVKPVDPTRLIAEVQALAPLRTQWPEML